MTDIRVAQYGTRHAHAAGKLRAIRQNPNVELVGVFEPDAARRRALAAVDGPFQDVHWFGSESEMLEDAGIAAIASEGPTYQSLDQTERCVQAGKHVWYDKPAGDNWPQWQRTIALAEAARADDPDGLYVSLSCRFPADRSVGEVRFSG